MVAAAIVGSAAIGAIGNAVGGSTQASGAQQAAAQLQPFSQAGTNVLPSLTNLATGNPMAQLSQLPGYQFTLNQGLKSVQNGFAARGLGSSGAALKGAASYATGLANQTYGDQFNRLLNLAGLGENAAAGVGNAYQNAATANASGITGAANSVANGLGNYAGYTYANNLFNNAGADLSMPSNLGSFATARSFASQPYLS